MTATQHLFTTFKKYNTGPMAERLGKGLQNPVQRFNSASDLRKLRTIPLTTQKVLGNSGRDLRFDDIHEFSTVAAVVELVDTGDLKSPDRKVMRVRFSPAAHTKVLFGEESTMMTFRPGEKGVVVIQPWLIQGTLIGFSIRNTFGGSPIVPEDKPDAVAGEPFLCEKRHLTERGIDWENSAERFFSTPEIGLPEKYIPKFA